MRVTIESLGGLCPVQAEGMVQEDGDPTPYYWYFRARGDRWTLEVYGSIGGAPIFTYGAPYGTPGSFLAGYLKTYEAAWFIWYALERFEREHLIDTPKEHQLGR